MPDIDISGSTHNYLNKKQYAEKEQSIFPLLPSQYNLSTQYVRTIKASGIDIFWIGTEAANLGIFNLKNCTFSLFCSV